MLESRLREILAPLSCTASSSPSLSIGSKPSLSMSCCRSFHVSVVPLQPLSITIYTLASSLSRLSMSCWHAAVAGSSANSSHWISCCSKQSYFALVASCVILHCTHALLVLLIFVSFIITLLLVLALLFLIFEDCQDLVNACLAAFCLAMRTLQEFSHSSRFCACFGHSKFAPGQQIVQSFIGELQQSAGFHCIR